MPPLIGLLREGVSPVCTDFAMETLGDKGREAQPATPDLIKLLEKEPATNNPVGTQRLAARALGGVGPDAKEALPSLIRLVEKHVLEEWKKVNAGQPVLRDDRVGGRRYSDDDFIDAICKIRGR